MSKEIDTIIDLYAKEGYVITREYADAISDTSDFNRLIEQLKQSVTQARTK